ncbi:MAG: DNA repair protein RecN [Deltaproteobacteria bacterium]|jgi:DNA repair protein RecN (Recombination protein N)|nr:DNA repair protein RecN [Deltaproteobacteria bacterium]
MLAELKVKNLVLIESLALTFGPGANLLTGETGAGKSVLVGALGLLKGQKSSAGLVRSGAEEAEVEALFALEDPLALAPLFQAQGLEPAEEIILRRQISATGRNRIRLNGSLITLAQLAAWGEELLAISSQHEQQSLINPARQLDFLDSFNQRPELLAETNALWRARESAAEAFRSLEKELAESREKKDLYEFQLAEIKKVNPQPAEDDILLGQKNLFRSGAKLTSFLSAARDILEVGQDCLLSRLERVRAALAKAAELDESWAEATESVAEMNQELSALADRLQSSAKGQNFRDSDLEAIEERLSHLARIKRKHGPTLDDVLTKGQRISEALARLAEAEMELSLARKKLAQAEEAALAKAQELSQSRAAAAQSLSANLVETLRALGFPKIQMSVAVEPTAPLGPKGVDHVNFLFCPNPGEGLRPLAKIASGGELSRVALALKIAQPTRSDQTLVFDEIDSGLSGGTAEAVAAKMGELASRQQIFVITHLPQMASLPGRHFLVAKAEDELNDRTITTIKELPPDDRARELARMLGGACPSPEALALSNKLLGLS